MNTDELSVEIRKCIAEIDHQMVEAKEAAKGMGVFEGGISPYQMRDMNGGFVLTPLLLAKAQLLSALAQFEW